MKTPSTRDEHAALARLQDYKRTGELARSPAPEVLRRLERERFVQTDEYGAAHITERGERHLGRLRRIGALRRGR